jgi:hypothetical protein
MGSLSENEGTWQPAQDILAIQEMLSAKGIGTAFALRYDFDVLEPLEGEFYLVMEAPQDFEVLMNGQWQGRKMRKMRKMRKSTSGTSGTSDGTPHADDPEAGWWLDPAFRKIEVSEHIHPGRNTILFKGKMGLETELEAIYLLGHFAVDRKRKGQAGRHTGQWFDLYEGMGRLKKAANLLVPQEHGSLTIDLTEQGFSNFAGRVTIRKIVNLLGMKHLPREAWLRFENLRAAVAHIHVNHQEVGSLAWQPHRIEISRALKVGENLIEIELVNSLRNLLGPLHAAGGEGDYTGPGEYREPRQWTDDHVLAPFGFDRVVLEFFEPWRLYEIESE